MSFQYLKHCDRLQVSKH